MSDQAAKATSAKPHVVVYSYGVHYKWVRDLPEVVVQQLRWGNRLWNDLVAEFRDYEGGVAEVWSRFPDVATAETALAVAEEAERAAAEKVKKERSRQRTKRITGPVADDAKAAKEALKTAQAALKTAKANVFEEATSDFSVLAEERKKREKAAYKTFAQDGALYHSTFTDIADNHRAAVGRLKKQRADAARNPGAPYPELRFHRFDGTGRMAVKLQRSSGEPPRTPETLADMEVGRYRNVLAIPGWVDPAEWEVMSRAEQRKRGRVVARMRVGGAGTEGGGEIIAIPIQVDRMLPREADITGARLVVKKVGSKTVATLNVTAKLPAAESVTDGPVVAVHFGWRREDSGVRVATWRSDAPLDVPMDLRHVMTCDPSRTSGTVVIPDRLADRKEALEKAQSLRDDSLNAVKGLLIDWLVKHGPVPHPVLVDDETGVPVQVTAASVAKWRSPGRIAVLAHHWRLAPPVGKDNARGDTLAADLEGWRSADKKAWDAEAYGSRRLINHRNDMFAQIAAVLGFQARCVLLDDTAVADLAQRTKADEDLTNEAAARIGHQRALAAPGTLRERITQTCVREGVEVVSMPAKNLTREHVACGHINDTSTLRSHEVECAGCRRKYDIDRNAVALMLTREVPVPAA